MLKIIHFHELLELFETVTSAVQETLHRCFFTRFYTHPPPKAATPKRRFSPDRVH